VRGPVAHFSDFAVFSDGPMLSGFADRFQAGEVGGDVSAIVAAAMLIGTRVNHLYVKNAPWGSEERFRRLIPDHGYYMYEYGIGRGALPIHSDVDGNVLLQVAREGEYDFYLNARKSTVTLPTECAAAQGTPVLNSDGRPIGCNLDRTYMPDAVVLQAAY